MKRMKRTLALVLILALTIITVPAVYAAEPEAEGAAESPPDRDPTEDPDYVEYIKDDKFYYAIIAYAGCTHDIGAVAMLMDEPAECHTRIPNHTHPYAAYGEALSGKGWSYSVTSRTLTLNDFTGSGIFVRMSATRNEEETFNVKLSGKNVLKCTRDQTQPTTFKVNGGSLNIHGPGSLTVSSERGYGIHATQNGSVPMTSERSYDKGAVYSAPVAGKVRVKDGAVVQTTGYWQGLMCNELVTDSKTAVIAHSTITSDVGPGAAISAEHINCNGTIIGTSSSSSSSARGFSGSSYYTIGSIVTAYAGADVRGVKVIELTAAESVFYGLGTKSWGSNNMAPYMAMIEGGFALEGVTLPGGGAATAPAPAPAPTPSTPSAPKVGDPLGDVLYTDIVAYINGKAIPSHNVGGNTYIGVEDLMKYGFDVAWDGAAKTLKVTGFDPNKTVTPIAVSKETAAVGTFKTKHVYTDVKTYVGDKQVEGLNINGQTLIQFDLLKEYGKVSWDAQKRELRLVI